MPVPRPVAAAVLCLLLVCGAAPAAVAQDGMGGQDVLEQARTLADEGSHEEALQLLEPAIRTGNEEALRLKSRILVGWAESLVIQEEWQAAAEARAQANPEHLELVDAQIHYYQLGRYWAEADEHGKSLEALEQHLETFPHAPLALLLAAEMAIELERWEQAETYLDRLGTADLDASMKQTLTELAGRLPEDEPDPPAGGTESAGTGTTGTGTTGGNTGRPTPGPPPGGGDDEGGGMLGLILGGAVIAAGAVAVVLVLRKKDSAEAPAPAPAPAKADDADEKDKADAGDGDEDGDEAAEPDEGIELPGMKPHKPDPHSPAAQMAAEEKARREAEEAGAADEAGDAEDTGDDADEPTVHEATGAEADGGFELEPEAPADTEDAPKPPAEAATTDARPAPGAVPFEKCPVCVDGDLTLTPEAEDGAPLPDAFEFNCSFCGNELSISKKDDGYPDAQEGYPAACHDCRTWYCHECLPKRGEDHFDGLCMKRRKAVDLVTAGIHLAQNGDMEGAIEQFREASDADPKYAEARQCLAMGWGEKGDLERAKKHAEAAVEIAPHHAEYSATLDEINAAG